MDDDVVAKHRHCSGRASMHHSLRTPLRFLQHVPSPAAPASAVTPATAATIAGHSDEDEDNDDEMVGRILSRREVLTLDVLRVLVGGERPMPSACHRAAIHRLQHPQYLFLPTHRNGNNRLRFMTGQTRHLL